MSSLSRPRLQSGLLALAWGAALVLGCGPEAARAPSQVTFLTWSDGERLEAVERLVGSFDAAQEQARARVSPWPAEPGSKASGAGSLAALDRLSEVDGEPALLEIPETVLPAFLAAERAADLRVLLRDRFGVRWDDFLPWLMPASLVESEGVRAIPFLVETPMLAFSPEAGLEPGDGQDLLSVLLELSLRPQPEQPDRGGGPAPRALAAAADHRIFLSLLSAEGFRCAPGGAPCPLDAAEGRRALGRLEALAGGSTRGRGRTGEEHALDDLLEGRALACWLWSGGAEAAAEGGLSLARAPAGPRGTYLVVNARADWRTRQEAARLARWLTEPQQTATLAAELGTVPVRRSALDGATHRGLAEAEPWRREAARERPGAVLPPGPLLDALVGVLEPAMARGELGPSVLAAIDAAAAEAAGPEPAGEGDGR